jgi:hypothetical protein
MAEQKYVVIAPFAGTLTRGDVVAEEALPGPAKEMAEQGTIRKATAEEAKGTQVPWWELKDEAPQEEPVELAPLPPVEENMGEGGLIEAQVGKEATPGTAVTANRLLTPVIPAKGKSGGGKK